MKKNIIEISITRYLYISILFFVAVFIARILVSTEHDYDLWLHLFLGKEILSKNLIPSFDVYSFTAYGSPMFDHEWLTQILFYWVYDLAGDFGLFVLRAFIYLAIFFLFFRLLRTKIKNNFYLCVILFMQVSVMKPGISFRIQMFTYLFTSLLVYLEEKRVSLNARMIIYPVLFLLWANMHGGFALGLVVVSVYCLGRCIEYVSEDRSMTIWKSGSVCETKSLLLVVACVLLTLCNPYGYKLWIYVFHEITTGRSSEYITEWRRFSFEPRERAFFVMFAVSWMAALWSFKRQTFSSFLLLLLGSYLGFSAVRHTPFLAILAMPCLLHAFSDVPQRAVAESLYSIFAAALFLLLSLFLVSATFPVRLNIEAIEDPLPTETVEFIENSHLTGNMFVPLHWGGYVLQKLYPDIKVSIDGRWKTTYPESIMDLNMRLYNIYYPEQIVSVADKYDANLILFENGHPEINHLAGLPDWEATFVGKVSTLVMRQRSATIDDRGGD